MPVPLILVVEDEPLLRMAALELIEDAGFEVVGARSAEDAIAVLEKCNKVRTVFTDVDLGRGKDGLWLAAHISERWPPIRIIVTSGHRHVTHDLVPKGAVFIGKPYLEDVVITAIRGIGSFSGNNA